MALHRTFSFDEGDERVLSANEQERLNVYSNHSSPYRDSPSRPSTISPPPHYSSPPPPIDEPVSPITPTRSRNSYRDAEWDLSDRRFDANDTARPILDSYQDSPGRFSPSPPRPPPHRRLQSVQADDNRDFWHGNTYQRQSVAEPTGVMGNGRRLTGSSGSSTVHSSGGGETMGRDRHESYSSFQPLANGASTPGTVTPNMYPSGYSAHNTPLDEYPMPSAYHDSPYLRATRNHHDAAHLAAIDPYSIADDGDDGFIPDPKRKSVLNRARKSSRDVLPKAAAGAGGAAGATGVLRSLSGMMGRRDNLQSQSSNYDPVDLSNSSSGISGGSSKAEKSEWLSRQTQGKNKMKWTLLGIIGGVILVAIVGGVIGGVIASKHRKSTSPSSSDSSSDSSDDSSSTTDLGKDSSAIKALMNNTELHKVFPAIDYTPWGTQYPLCMTYPPLQANVTKDMAVLSQLTNTVRLYGTDCNQTQMVLHAIDRLELTEMKVWLGVWIDQSNATTTDRQMSTMYEILENSTDHSIFKGVILGNEVLYRAGTDNTTAKTALVDTIKDVRTNFTSKGYNLTVATSDLGDDWNTDLVEAVDVVMSNIHPFFAGVTASNAASWTWEFWQNHDAALTQGTSKKQVISETGWPSAGGNDCGTEAGCATTTSGSVAGIPEMNQFMADWVCDALKNGTEYFWFEAFDEPWKVIYNTPGKNWEDKWGLMDEARNVKEGLKIPDCGGQTVD